MSIEPRRQFITLSLILGAVVFGMVLASGLQLTPTSSAAAPAMAQSAEGAVSVEGLTGAWPSFADLAEAVSPAVVSVESVTIESGQSPRGQDPFQFFFRRQRPDADEPEREFRSDSGGSGFFISDSGLVVTNFHVIDGASEIYVRIGEDRFPAKVRGTDQATDIALLEVETAHQVPFLALGDSDAVRVGDWAVAVGSPLGLADTVTVGVVSAKGRQINIAADQSLENFIQTDAAINFGNSGGPLLNVRGEVIGINTAINFGSENIGFAVPVNTLKIVLPQLRDEGRVRRGYLGIEIDNLSEAASESFGLDSRDGVLVVNVLADLPADRAGVEHGDVILTADGRTLANTRALIDYVSSRSPDDTIDLEVLRRGKRMKLEVNLSERPSAEGQTQTIEEPQESELDWLGIRYQDLTPEVRSQVGIPDDVGGLWITSISPRSPLYDAGLRETVVNVVTEVNGQQIGSSADFEQSVQGAKSGERLRMYVRQFRRGEELSPAFVFPKVP